MITKRNYYRVFTNNLILFVLYVKKKFDLKKIYIYTKNHMLALRLSVIAHGPIRQNSGRKLGFSLKGQCTDSRVSCRWGGLFRIADARNRNLSVDQTLVYFLLRSTLRQRWATNTTIVIIVLISRHEARVIKVFHRWTYSLHQVGALCLRRTSTEL